MVSWILDLARDVRYGARTLRRTPAFTSIAVLSLALGIGGATSVFALVNAIVLRSLPIPNAGQLFVAERHRADQVSTRFSWPTFELARDALRGRAALAAATSPTGMQIQPDGSSMPVRGTAQLVSGEYFELLQQQPQLGRLLVPADNQQASATVALVSDGFWRRELGTSPTVIGQKIAINGVPFTIVGVTSPGFFGTTVALRNPDVWLPLMTQPLVHYAGNVSSHGSSDTRKPWPPQDDVEWLTVFVRVSPPDAATAIASTFTAVHRNDAERRLAPGSDANDRRGIESERILLTSAARGVSSLRNGLAAPLFVVLAMVGVLLAIACGNVAGLLIARATAREREIAIRLSIGAGHGRLVRQLLAESLLLAGASGALGLGFAVWGHDVLLALFARVSSPSSIDLDAGIDWRVLGFSVLVSLATGLACGLLPALRAARVPVSESLKIQGRSAGAEGRRGLLVGKLLVAAQVAFCLLLLVVAGLFLRSLRTLMQSDIGFDREHVLATELDVGSLGYSDEQRQALYDRIVQRVSALPGVRSASFSMNGPLARSAWTSGMTVEGHQTKPGERLTTNEEAVTERYFETVGLRLLEGRLFGPEDRSPASRAVVINKTMARRFFGAGSAVGKRFDYGDSIGTDSFVIVGVVEDARYVDLKAAPPNMAYHLTTSVPESVLRDLEIRTDGSPAALAGTVRRTLQEEAPGLPVVRIQSLADRVDDNLSNDRMIAALTSAFGGLALLLACLGLYGTVSYGISRRVSELGLRMALGADRSMVLWMVMREALLLVGAGAAIGVPLAFVAGRSVRSLLYTIVPADPVSYAAGSVLLLVVAALAAYVPAYRASRIEPMIALGRN